MKKFFSKKLNLLSVVLAVLGLVGILVMLIVPHGGKYTRTYTELEKEWTTTYELKDGKIYSSKKVDGEYITQDALLGEYVIDGGKLSYKVPLTGVSVELGDINAFRYQPKGAEDVKYTCTLTVIFFVVACVMTVLGLAGVVCGALKTNKKSTKKAKAKK